MQRLDNLTLQKFIDRLVETFKRENQEEKKLDIPFLISALYQSFKNNTDKYKDFINDLNVYSDYNMYVESTKDDWYGIANVRINLFKYNKDYDSEYDYYSNLPNYHYEICFFREYRNWGCCECTPDMPDYREDKCCCGHGCDACFSAFELHKVIEVALDSALDSWQGDEHDYWDFEDDFYKTDKELLLKKQEEDRKLEIEMCKKYIEEYTKKLSELENKENQKQDKEWIERMKGKQQC